ncbi:hypothetical protein Acr_07g0015920 [Actinidia rufa]|uniref:Aminotransferase class V domain-containing protein n=1 Tax=Actinidia rufa TaxID=165716 RepID=A0A7J0EYY0_9ERIC|nr:hypothetical protein Acr_07g0015920 [Actinidia rufa]
MELEQPILRSSKAYISPNQGQNYASNIVSSPIQTSSQVSDDLSHHRILENGAPPATDSADKKLSWLRSQIIGGDMEFDSPFGKRRLTYADHTASGRGLKFIEDYIMNNVLPFYGNSHTSDSYVGYKTTKMVHEAAEYVKRCLGGGQDDAILFCGSGSTAAIKRLQEVMGIAIPSIMRDKVFKSLSSEYKRWVVFVGPYEHHSNILSWRQSLAEVVEISLDENGLLDMEALRLQLREYQGTNRPMLGSFSACSNVTGTYTDTGALARLLHQFGAYACFDFAASGPYVEIDMRSGEIDGYDAVFLSPHKFLGGPGTPGLLLMSKALYKLGSSPPSTCGGGTVSFVNGFNEKDTLYVDNIEEREDAGTPPIIQKIKAALAFWVKEYIGYEVIDKQEHDYIKAAMDRLLPNQNIWILGNISAKRQAILSFLIYSTTYSSSAEIRPYGHSLLNVDERLSLSFKSAIQMGYNGVKPGWTRISFPYYMSHEEFEFTLAALEFIAIYGQRFLPLYHLNWKTGSWSFKRKVLKETLQSIDQNRNYYGCSPMVNMMQTLNVNSHELQEHHEVDANSDGLINKYASYLEAAKRIAGLLPTFPPQRRVPDDLDLNLVPFRV